MRTVRVRIAVAVSHTGKGVACGMDADSVRKAARYESAETFLSEWAMLDGDVGENPPYYCAWVEADIPVPDVPVIEGEVK